MIEHKAEEFARYLVANGAEIKPKTNPWELIRYVLPECGVIVIYQNAKGRVTMCSEAEDHFRRFESGKALDVHKRIGSDAKARLHAKLKLRDGETCCFCGQFLEDDETLEHWLSIASGGNNTQANTALAHAKCNLIAASMDIMDKIAFRDRLHQAAAAIPPWDELNPYDSKEAA